MMVALAYLISSLASFLRTYVVWLLLAACFCKQCMVLYVAHHNIHIVNCDTVLYGVWSVEVPVLESVVPLSLEKVSKI
jgi:hypothetical protein